MDYKVFKLGKKLEIYLSSTIKNEGFEVEILPRLTYWKTPVYTAQRKCVMTRTVVMAWLTFYLSFTMYS